MTRARSLGVLLLGTTLAVGAVEAQTADPVLANRPMATRAQLQSLVTELEKSQPTAAPVAVAKARLNEGDFRAGDLVLLEVQGEAALSDTFAVGPDRSLTLPAPAVGSMPLQGVLRAELQERASEFVAKFVRNPVVRARPLVRLSVQGEVVRAGYYGVPADALLSDALMAAGGTTAEADIKKLRIERNGTPLLEGKALERAFAESKTVDDLSLRPGDQFVVAKKKEGNFTDGLRLVWTVVSIAGGIYGLSRAF
jgi:protein involved in polysaccharide export with SLBB domain